MVLPDRYIEHGSPEDQFESAGLTSKHIAGTVLNLLGRPKEALQLHWPKKGKTQSNRVKMHLHSQPFQMPLQLIGAGLRPKRKGILVNSCRYYKFSISLSETIFCSNLVAHWKVQTLLFLHGQFIQAHNGVKYDSLYIHSSKLESEKFFRRESLFSPVAMNLKEMRSHLLLLTGNLKFTSWTKMGKSSSCQSQSKHTFLEGFMVELTSATSARKRRRKVNHGALFKS